ncbi:hypothetical protein V1514DRAFT_369809 [Lipomyces japonicus]|uniref:uncharacterized protein n=1 Tax=Lipomyces japonicus TaxID=56871 RepID=UPI0034CD8E6C
MSQATGSTDESQKQQARSGLKSLNNARLDPDESPEAILKRFETDPYKMYPDDPDASKHNVAISSKVHGKFYDPCKLTAQMSLNCLDRSKYNNKTARRDCKEYFDAYKECKAAWTAAQRQRRLDSI